MDDLLRDFLIESSEHLETIDAELVRFEQNPNNQEILSNIFRLVHTIKGTCGFLGLPRLETLAHAAETLMGKFRDGMPVTSDAVTLILTTLDRIKALLAHLEQGNGEPDGSDADLIERLETMAAGGAVAVPAAPVPAEDSKPSSAPYQTLERPLMPGEIPLDELERIFREAPGPDEVPPAATPAPAASQSAPAARTAETPSAKQAQTEGGAGEGGGTSAKSQTIRVNVETLEHLMTMVSELVLTRNQLLEISRHSEDSAYKVPLQRLSQVTAELQDSVMKTRMQPIGNAWQKLPRLVRDLSAELGKKIDLVMIGADTELDRQVLEVIKDPLTHMVRNSADHGLESPEERRAVGKAEKGVIQLKAYHEGGNVTIEISDDGRGLNLAAIRKKALERGIVTEAELERMGDAQVGRFIFHPGFSTAAVVTSVSGRGVGMDVVKTNIETIGGTVDIRSEPGKGTTFIIKIPLTLAIASALIVASRGQRYAIPQVAVMELVRVAPGSDQSVERLNGSPVLRLRDRLLPIVPLAGVLGQDVGSTDEGFVVVTETGSQRFGLLVDGVFHTEEIVVKPMSSKLRHLQIFSGNTILGDGAVVLIIDPNGVAAMVGTGESDDAQAGGNALATAGSAHEETTTFLLFRGADDGIKAVQLSLVTRLEEIDASTIEWTSGGQPVIQYRGRLMPIVPIDGLEIRRDGTQNLLVFSDGTIHMGLAVSEIVDIVEDRLEIEIASDRDDIIGTAVIRRRATEVINVGHYLGRVASAQRGTIGGARRSVLLVEGSPLGRNMLATILSTAGHAVTAASGADEALQGLSAADVAIVDLDHAGIALVERIRAGAERPDVPVIGLASGRDEWQLSEARRLGLVDVVLKTDRKGLLDALSEANELREAA
jgi:Chemotaxis protein histidine kinase and related kinases